MEDKLITLGDIKSNLKRMSTCVKSIDEILGGGIPEKSILLTSGQPGSGKSTIWTMIAAKMAHDGKRILYISGEEALEHLKLRAERCKLGSPKTMFIEQDSSVENLFRKVNRIKPHLIVIDSIRSLYRKGEEVDATSLKSVKTLMKELIDMIHETQGSISLIGHATKGGQIGGALTLQHDVDITLYIERDEFSDLRILRPEKNRFGPVDKIFTFALTEGGIREVATDSMGDLRIPAEIR